MSMGLAVASPNDDAAKLYERADQALYKSKQLGRNRLYTITDSNAEIDVQSRNEADADDGASYEKFKASFTEANLDG